MRELWVLDSILKTGKN